MHNDKAARWTSLLAGNALSHGQKWQMNTQRDAEASVIWCSLSNRFTADHSGQRRIKSSSAKSWIKWTLTPSTLKISLSLHLRPLKTAVTVSFAATSWAKKHIFIIAKPLSTIFIIQHLTLKLRILPMQRDWIFCKGRYFLGSLAKK